MILFGKYLFNLSGKLDSIDKPEKALAIIFSAVDATIYTKWQNRLTW